MAAIIGALTYLISMIYSFRLLGLLALFQLAGSAQLVSNPKAIPHTGKLPVVFLNGYETDCSVVNFQRSFGIADQVLQSDSRVSLFFNNCSYPSGNSIEKLGSAFGAYLASLTYDDGQPVTRVDVVGYSMGGLILRSYLSGKQEAQGSFSPPASVPINKIVFIASPNFGTPVAAVALGVNQQTDELTSGSHFLMDLNTWNQNHDDLRGLDAIAIAGTGGTGIATSPGLDDGLVPISSGSIRFYKPGRTRLLPLCHVMTPGLLTQVGLCPSNAKGISKVTSANDDSIRIVLSFLNGTLEWQSIGVAAEQSQNLQSNGGLLVRARTARDAKVEPSSVRATAANGSAKDLNMSNSEIASTDLIAAGNVSLVVNAGSQSFTQTVNLPAGGASAYVLKQGPRIDAIIPAPALISPLVVAPRMIVSIYGNGLGQSTVTFNRTALTTSYVGDQQINALMPADAPLGLNQLTVQNSTGSQTVNVYVEAAFPAVFTLPQFGAGVAAAINGNTGAVVTQSSPLHGGEYAELFLTGLGSRGTQPVVTVGGKDCAVSYAGPAPGFPGLDQINCVVPAGLGAQAAQVVVSSGGRSSPVTTIAVQ